MDIIVNSRSKDKKEFIHACVLYYIQNLNLERSRYFLTVNSVPRFKLNTKAYGQTYKVAYRHLYIDIDSRLNLYDTITTLAHEMVHVRQIALGQLRYEKNSYGGTFTIWRGKRNRKHYQNQPWEIEAYTMEKELSESLITKIAKDIKKL